MNGLLNEKEAAEYLNVSVGLLRRWRLFRQGPNYVKLGRLVRYERSALEAYINGAIVK
jgi:excisionase family DNA binding protein